MSSGAPWPPGRRGASLLSILASSALAVLAVLVLVGVLILAFGTNDDRTDQAGVDSLVTVAPTTPTPEASALATPQPTVGPPALPTAVPSATSSPSATASPRATASPSAGRAARSVARAPVIVLNQTSVPGLAAKVRDRLRAGGWTVTGIDDFRGNVPATTVYYPPGLQAAARALMAQFPEIGRIRPAFAGISTTHLTVILGKDYPTRG